MQREPWGLLKSLLTLTLIFLCLWAAQWQYQRGVDRHARNSVIEKRITLPAIPLRDLALAPASGEWRMVTTSGTFDRQQQILLRNRYSEGVYGFEVLTLFTSTDKKTFWVDRGWVKAGKDATKAPIVIAPPSQTVSITGRLRLDSSLPRGSFFALPSSGTALVAQLNAQSRLQTQGFYLDLLSGSEETLTPVVGASLPELSDGPHMAYALQWIFFAGLILYGRLLIRRTR